MGHIGHEDRAILPGEGREFGKVGDPGAIGRDGGQGDDQPPAPGLAGETHQATLHPFDRGGRAAVGMGLRQQYSLEHGRMGGRIEDDVVAGAQQCAEGLADCLGPGWESGSGGKLQEGGEVVFERKDRGRAILAGGDEAMATHRGHRGGADGGMGG
jgi:hypothetical protein